MKDKFFDRLDWVAFWTATLITMVVYFFTLGPSVGLEDSGELATAAAYLGVPHPPGYPFWTLCSWIFCKIFSFVTYMGHPTPAWCVSLFSATAGAFAAGCTAMLICRSARDFVTTHPYLAFGGAVAGALTFSLSPVEWSQSTIVEIYSLNALFLMWVFLLTYRWMRKPSDAILWYTAFVFGLGLTNYQVLLFAIVPLAIVIAMTKTAMFRDVFIYLCPVAMVYQLLDVGQLNRASAMMQSDAINKHLPVEGLVKTPSTTLVIVAVAFVVLALVVSAILRARKDEELAKKVLLGGGIFGAVLMLLGSFLFTSMQSWATPLELEIAPLIEPTRYAFIGAFVLGSVVAAAFSVFEERRWNNALIVSVVLAGAAVMFAMMVPEAGSDGYCGAPYPWGKSVFMFMVALIALFALTAFTPKGLSFAIPTAGFHIAAFILLSRGAMNGLTHPASWWFGWPIAWNFVLLALAWLTLPNGRSVAGAAFFTQLGAAFYAYMPIVSDLRNPPMNWGYPRTWEGFKHAIQRGQYEAITFNMPTWDGIKGYFADVHLQFTAFIAAFALVPFAVGHWIVKKENRKLFWQWMVAAVSCFLLMSVLLIGLANVKGDIQDGFIQKVKFISSHAMIALWIGYGIVFAVMKVNRCIKLVALALILIAGGIPIAQNYLNDDLVFRLGGNEQNGHTFGWQFGAYQLEGANAIKEQIEADEEPLPDPTYPLPMDKFSIFFGGTDPGRFVPTYMIYSANFRPDVYLITQNALADDTYMSVERDLYGDEIWIPAKEDSAEAFNIYVDEVQSGKRQANGDLKIENGRVQVTGALGVMEINGILTKMMHDHDRLKHSFYVEESYVIQWMYPYLSPHGLIMKLNAENTPYDAKRAVQDNDFWDWYVRRLLNDPMYRRDFAGQKSFSKLRAAIAGLYQKQNRYSEGSQAFREAVLLYPASPEAVFRYAHESLLPFARYDAILELMDNTDRLDPNNSRTGRTRSYVVSIRKYTALANRLEAAKRKGPLSIEDTIRLADAYAQLGRIQLAASIIHPIINKLNDAQHLNMVLPILLDARTDADAEVCLNKYLKLNPQGDANAWAELAKIQYRQGRRQAAQQSFLMGYRIDAQSLFERLQRDQELYEIAAPLFQRRK